MKDVISLTLSQLAKPSGYLFNFVFKSRMIWTTIKTVDYLEYLLQLYRSNLKSLETQYTPRTQIFKIWILQTLIGKNL